MSSTIQLTRYAPPAPSPVYPIKVVAVGIGSVPSEIFVYHVGAAADGNDLFYCVATAKQLAELPTVPTPAVGGKRIPFYRSATAVFVCLTEDGANNAWTELQQDAQDLMASIDAMGNIISSFPSVEVTATTITQET